MFKYKREINNFNQARELEYALSDNSKVTFCTTGSLYTKKPYHGYYIKDQKILLENLVETFEIGDTTYKMVEIDTRSKELNTKDYITQIDLDKNYFEYNLDEKLNFSKRFAFAEKNSILCVEYTVKNLSRENATFNVVPLITYRDYYNMKNKSMLKFNQRETNNGTFISLSVLNQVNLSLKSDKMSWQNDTNYLCDVKHELITKEAKKEIYFEDLAICGKFTCKVNGFSEAKFYVYISDKDFDIQNINTLDVFNNIQTRNKNITFGIDENYVELIELSKSMLNTDMEDLAAALPARKEYNEEYITNIKNLTPKELEEDVEELTDIVRSIEGKYLYFNKIGQAKKTVFLVYKIVKEMLAQNLDENIRQKVNILRLWYIESVNRILQKEGRIELYMESIKETLYNLVLPENRVKCFKNIEITALMLNAIKIYLNILTWIGDVDKQMEIQEDYFTKLIRNEFWIKDKNIMKRDLNEETSYANIEMLYTLSLSFPCITDDEIPNKLLDSVFKELYTPYGLRKVSKYSPTYDGLIYPKYMSYFIKANLRLTGVTRASQKIAYNLVKELLQDVGKYVNGGVKKIYSEKGLAIDCMSYDVHTNAEIIRLYNMFM